MIQFQENVQTDERTDRPYFIEPSRLPPGVQQKVTLFLGCTIIDTILENLLSFLKVYGQSNFGQTL